MKKLNITKEQFNRSRYFKNKYGELEYVSESGKLFKTSKGKVLKFNESNEDDLTEQEYEVLNKFCSKIELFSSQLQRLVEDFKKSEIYKKYPELNSLDDDLENAFDTIGLLEAEANNILANQAYDPSNPPHGLTPKDYSQA